MGLDQDALSYMYLGRKERLTEVRGEIVKEHHHLISSHFERAEDQPQISRVAGRTEDSSHLNRHMHLRFAHHRIGQRERQFKGVLSRTDTAGGSFTPSTSPSRAAARP